MDTFTCGACCCVFTALDTYLNHKQVGCNNDNNDAVSIDGTSTTTVNEELKSVETVSHVIESTPDYVVKPDVAQASNVVGVTDVTPGTDVTPVTDITQVTDVTDVTQVTEVSGVTQVTDVTDFTVAYVTDSNTIVVAVTEEERAERHLTTGVTLNSSRSEPDVVLTNDNKQDPVGVSLIYACKHCDACSASLAQIESHCSQEHKMSTNVEITDSIRLLTPLDKNCNTVAVQQNAITQQQHTIPRKRGRPRKNPLGKLTQTAAVFGIGNENIPIMAMADQMLALPGAPDVVPKEKPLRRKPGRPRKSEQATSLPSLGEKKKIVKEVQCFWDEENMMCRNCKMKFSRLRQLHSHRCIVDILEKEMLPDDESSTNSQDENIEMVDSPIANVSAEKRSNGILKFEITEEEQFKIEQDVCAHEIPQRVNDKAPSHPSKFTQNSLKVYTCPYCKKLFKFKQGMIHHVRSHTNYKPFKCSQCDYASASKGNLKTHERKHTGERFKCTLCSFTSISKGHLNVHVKRHKKLQTLCELCSKNVYTLTNLLRHLEVSHEINVPGKARKYYEKKRLQSRAGRRSMLFQCNICQRKFKTKRELDNHMLLHQDKKPYLCTLCNYKSVRQPYLEQHVRKHRQVYFCCLCKNKHLSIQLLKDHLVIHSLENGWSQDKQEQLFVDSINCSMYLAEVLDKELESARFNQISAVDLETSTHVDFLEATQNATTLEMNNGQPAKINDEFGGEVISVDVLKEILGLDQCVLRFKRLNLPTFQAIQKLFGEQECRTCGKLFRFKTHLENHARIHSANKEFKCSRENCKYSSHSQDSLKSHVENAHSGVQYKCTMCQFQTRSKVYLQTHIKKHVLPDVIKCTRCDASFGSEKEMKNHIADNHPSMLQEEIEKIIGRKIHIYRKQGKEWFQCEHCPQKFRRIAELRQHLWIHQGLTPYKCDICGHGTRSLSNLKAHMLRHSDTKTHLCDECGKAFKTKNSLKVHCLSQHTETGHDKSVSKITVKCNYCDFSCVQKSQLKKHLDIHTGNRHYRCGICIQHLSNTKCGLRSHYSKQHSGVEFDESLLEESEISAEQQTVMLYKCSQCPALCGSLQLYEDHLKKDHNLEFAKSSEEITDATLIQAATMAESSMEDSQVVDSSNLQIPVSGSAAELLQQIISVQGLRQLSKESNQIQIQLPILQSMTNNATAAVEGPVYTSSMTPDGIQTYSLQTQEVADDSIMDEQAQSEAGDSSASIMQVHFQVEGSAGSEQLFGNESRDNIQPQQIVVVKDGETIQHTYMEMASQVQIAEVVQVSVTSEDNENQQMAKHDVDAAVSQHEVTADSKENLEEDGKLEEQLRKCTNTNIFRDQ